MICLICKCLTYCFNRSISRLIGVHLFGGARARQTAEVRREERGRRRARLEAEIEEVRAGDFALHRWVIDD